VSEPDEYTPEMLARMSALIRDFIPHNKALGLDVVRVKGGEVWVKLPWAEKLVGNPATGALHGGAISSAMDATSGLAIMTKLGKPGSIATLDMRIDYLRAALRGEDVVIRATCYKVTKHVCFVRASAYTTDEADPVASLAATFARKGSR
jgi:uncharacterized protein (TIGR00369 family)